MSQPKSAADVRPTKSPPPPGWYTDGKHDERRWWDGAKWTDNYDPPRPAAPAPQVSPATPAEQISGAAVLGYVFAFLGPFVGFLIGLALIAKNDRHAVGVVVASIAAGFLWLVLVLGTL